MKDCPNFLMMKFQVLLTFIWTSCIYWKSVQGYCWAAGRNPSFTDAPKVEQLALDTVRVSWHDIVSQRSCADNFVVKFWPKDAPNQYEITDLIPTDQDSVNITVIPKIFYDYQAVAREDKGVVGGVDWNKSPAVEFRTRSNGNQVLTSENAAEIDAQLSDTGTNPYEKRAEVLGLSVELFITIVVIGLIVVLVFIGLCYRLLRGKQKMFDDDDSEDDEEDEGDDEDDEDDVEKGLTVEFNEEAKNLNVDPVKNDDES